MRPKIILNCAASADGKIALPNRRKLKISNEQDFERLHNLRNNCDAILVGIGTILEDNPSLTTDLGKKIGKNPTRIVLDTNFRTPVLQKKAKTSAVFVGKKENIRVRQPLKSITRRRSWHNCPLNLIFFIDFPF